MRLRHKNIKTFEVFTRTVKKDSEGGTYEEYGPAQSFKGIVWSTGGSVQQAMYGSTAPYTYSIKVDGKYTDATDLNCRRYILENGTVICEEDGVSLNTTDTRPQFQITAILPYEHLQLEVTRIDRRS